MTDLSTTVAPKSDQLNSDDLIAGPRTIKITAVKADPSSAEQPIAIYFEGDNNKPYKPCKSMRRVMIQVWGSDGSKFVGRSMTLYRDAKVQFGGLAVGGIRISHMTDLDSEMTMALTATRASRKPYTVKPLAAQAQPTTTTKPLPDTNDLAARYAKCNEKASFDALETERRGIWASLSGPAKAQLKLASDAAAKRLTQTPAATFDPQSAINSLREAGDIAALDDAWKSIVADCKAQGIDVPIDVEAVRNDCRDVLNKL